MHLSSHNQQDPNELQVKTSAYLVVPLVTTLSPVMDISQRMVRVSLGSRFSWGCRNSEWETNLEAGVGAGHGRQGALLKLTWQIPCYHLAGSFRMCTHTWVESRVEE